MKIEVTQSDYEQLQWLAKNYFVRKGERPIPIKEVLHRLVSKGYKEANPPQYQTSGFERQ